MTAPSPAVLEYEAARAVPPNHDRTLRLIAIVACVVFVIISATARVATYRVNPIFLIPLMWLPHLIRRRVFLHPVHYAMFAVAILLHDLGAYGFYQYSPLPFSWDILVHFYFGVVVTLMMHRAIALSYAGILRPWQASVTTLLFMMGIGALHEIMEYMSYLLLGEEKGMLKPHTSYFFDTQRDLTNNLLGAIVALVIAAVAARAFASPRDRG
jgi:uncharacterized membrane protein YjdF